MMLSIKWSLDFNRLTEHLDRKVKRCLEEKVKETKTISSRKLKLDNNRSQLKIVYL